MSGLPPTPLSECKRTLRLHSKTPGFNPVEEENKPSSGEEEGCMQYDLAEEGDTMESSGSGRTTGRDKQSECEAPEATDSSDGMPCSTMPMMPTLSANGMIMMTAVDLL
ncbi:hypothetical protein GX50_08920, partial [[Emmonsia] crescens]